MDWMTHRKKKDAAKLSIGSVVAVLLFVASFASVLAQSPQPTVVPAAASSASKPYVLTLLPPREGVPRMPLPPDPPLLGPVPDVPARVVYQPMPSRPPQAVRQQHEGTTIVLISYGADGNVLDVIVYKSSGYRELDRAAMDAAKTWRIQPGLKDGVPLKGRITAPITFSLPSH